MIFPAHVMAPETVASRFKRPLGDTEFDVAALNNELVVMINASLLQHRKVLKFNSAGGSELVVYLETKLTNTVTSLSSGRRICHANGSFDGCIPNSMFCFPCLIYFQSTSNLTCLGRFVD
jgi:hypothetical protein